MIRPTKEQEDWIAKINHITKALELDYQIKTENQYQLVCAGAPKDIVIKDEIPADLYRIAASEKAMVQVKEWLKTLKK